MAGYLQVLVGKVPGSVHMEQNLGVEVELLVVLDGLEEGLCVQARHKKVRNQCIRHILYPRCVLHL